MESCDAVIHSAALISIHGDPNGDVYRTNVEGTRNIMEAAKRTGVNRVIHISSIHAFHQLPANELLDEQRAKVSKDAFAYDRSKKEGEEIALSYASSTMDVLIINPTSIIGPFDDKPSKMGKVLIDLCNGKLPFVFKGGFDFCDVRDVSKAIVNGLTMGRSDQSYLLSGRWHSFQTLAVYLSKASGRKIRTRVLPPFLGWAGLPFVQWYGQLKKQEPLYTNEALVAITDGNRHINSDKAKQELHYTPRPLEETVRDTYEWFLKKGYLG
jgi:dihydroflavonol-4-reductase